MGSIALTGQKLLPTLQQIYSGFTYISSSYIAIERILNYLDLSDKNIYKTKDKPPNFLFKKDIVVSSPMLNYGDVLSCKLKYNKKQFINCFITHWINLNCTYLKNINLAEI